MRISALWQHVCLYMFMWKDIALCTCMPLSHNQDPRVLEALEGCYSEPSKAFMGVMERLEPTECPNVLRELILQPQTPADRLECMEVKVRDTLFCATPVHCCPTPDAKHTIHVHVFELQLAYDLYICLCTLFMYMFVHVCLFATILYGAPPTTHPIH